MRFNELTLTYRSHKIALSLVNQGAKRVTSKVSGKSIKAACDKYPDDICFENMSMFGDGAIHSYTALVGMGVKSLLVRCNADRDLVTVKVG